MPNSTLNICQSLLDVLKDLDEYWGNPKLGLVLTSARIRGVPATMRQLEEECGLSHETLRRNWINPLIKVQRVVVEREGKKHTYYASEAAAARTSSCLKSLCQKGVENPDWFFAT